MKNIVLAALASLSFSAFSQSYFVLDNGVTISVDSMGFIYDYAHYTPLNRLTLKGGQFLLEDNNILVTVDEKGSFFRKLEVLPTKVIGKGHNYFIGDTGTIYTIDTLGYVAVTENDPKAKAATKFGGTFFTTEDEFFVVTPDGKYAPVVIEGLKPSDIHTFGGNYFMTNRGVLYTVSEDGQIISKKASRIGIILKKGGNYFVDTTGMIYTVTQTGELKSPGLPVSLRVQAMTKLGVNYFMDGSGKLFTVDKEGNVFERWSAYDLKTTKVISL